MTTTPYGIVHSRRSFFDPDEYQAAIRGGDNSYTQLGRGDFRADVTDVEVGPVKLQIGRENLPRLAATSVPANKVTVLVWPDNSRLPIVRGIQIQPGEVLCLGLGMQSHHRTSGCNEFLSITLDASDLAQAAHDLTERELVVPIGKILRPPAQLLTQLLWTTASAIRVGETTPEVLSSPEAAKDLEQILLQPIIACLQHEDPHRNRVSRWRRAALAKRVEEAIEANLDRRLPSWELSRMIGLPGRSLRELCQEQLGMTPSRFLALRRLHLARQALLRADHHSMTVTQIAMDLGMWELGRFAVTYKALFGESPSATLRRKLGA